MLGIVSDGGYEINSYDHAYSLHCTEWNLDTGKHLISLKLCQLGTEEVTERTKKPKPRFSVKYQPNRVCAYGKCHNTRFT